MNITELSLNHILGLDTEKVVFSSDLARKCDDAKRKKIKDLSASEIRLLISQKIGLKYLIPIAVEILEQDILIETEYYKGDLAVALFECNVENLDLDKETKTKIWEIAIELNTLSRTISEDILPLLPEAAKLFK
ncbi:contact-dependent growth inhibition system immunity protein [Curvivirga sp.]|uniref:contact-dependent growth inhibition system immunity protein n=1 Tax=Curvivirga sp. TaxID=2856848 RepID=UPI003B5B421B